MIGRCATVRGCTQNCFQESLLVGVMSLLSHISPENSRWGLSVPAQIQGGLRCAFHACVSDSWRGKIQFHTRHMLKTQLQCALKVMAHTQKHTLKAHTQCMQSPPALPSFTTPATCTARGNAVHPGIIRLRRPSLMLYSQLSRHSPCFLFISSSSGRSSLVQRTILQGRYAQPLHSSVTRVPRDC